MRVAELGRLVAVEQHVRGEALRQPARGRLSNENIVRTTARSAGTNAARYIRGSITVAATYNPVGSSTTAPRILLVDDELAVQKLLTYPLRKEGYDVVPALDGREALDRLREDSFDLVVLDVMLPRMDGFDVCRAIRSRSTVPIIMLTAKTEEIDKVLGLELGADDYITKPFSVREFRSRVKAVLRRAALRPARGASSRSRSTPASCRSTSRSAASSCAASRRSSPTSSSRSWPRSRARPGACSAARCCSSGSGATPPTATRARSTCTSATCARSWRRSRRRPS